MDPSSTDRLIRRFIAGDRTATEALIERARAGDDPATLVAAALVVPAWQGVLARAAQVAEGARERQIVALAAAFRRGEIDRALVLARDHLAEHPESLLVAHIAAASVRRT
ncbi:hypothetical protein [Actinomycetospora callitridis]|uniref:hypothetical protein n=1 Tax=Actinomycetospora callitridis TaxID=913944 RepID=UPI002366F3E3|nr:hypothetical protein [Actinomycetospora callitridis]MDD7920199.1 hypothetical protein [Actinomycetospora callitridis]